LTEKVWDDPSEAPGNELIKLHSAKLRSLTQQNSREISVEFPIELQFEFWNYQSGVDLSFTIHLLTIGGTQVFATNSGSKRRPRGLVRETIKIPANFLNDGMYTITLHCGRERVPRSHHQDILVFEVLDRGKWGGRWPGVIRPKLEWVSQDIEGGALQL